MRRNKSCLHGVRNRSQKKMKLSQSGMGRCVFGPAAGGRAVRKTQSDRDGLGKPSALMGQLSQQLSQWLWGVSILRWPAWSDQTLPFSMQMFSIRNKAETEDIFIFMCICCFFLHAILKSCRGPCAQGRWSYKLFDLQACLHCPRHSSEFEMVYVLHPKLSGTLCCLPSPERSSHLQQAGLFCFHQPQCLEKDANTALKIWMRPLLMSAELYDLISRPMSVPRPLHPP